MTPHTHQHSAYFLLNDKAKLSFLFIKIDFLMCSRDVYRNLNHSKDFFNTLRSYRSVLVPCCVCHNFCTVVV
jgi:hypothetical protein